MIVSHKPRRSKWMIENLVRQDEEYGAMNSLRTHAVKPLQVKIMFVPAGNSEGMPKEQRSL